MSIPFHADIVGSFLRPQSLKTGKEELKAGKITKERLEKIEDAEVEKLVNKLSSLGLKNVTDGEFKRSMWHIDFQVSLLGVKFITFDKPFFHTTSKHIPVRPDTYSIQGKIEYNPNNPFFNSFVHLQSIVSSGIIPKVTIPSPAMFLDYFFGLPLPDIYKNNKTQLVEDISLAYNKTIKHFYDLGCRYLQLDDCMLIRASVSAPPPDTPSPPPPPPLPAADGGPPPFVISEEFAQLPATCVKVINGAIKGLPTDLAITMHICRGNYRSDFFGGGFYDSIADSIAQINVNGFFLEYDDNRSGTFAPLSKIATNGKNQRVVLGLVTSKRPELEKEEDLVARIDDAAKYFPKERLCLSSQCGFASCEEGNVLTEDEQWAKIALVVGVAKKVWGSL